MHSITAFVAFMLMAVCAVLAYRVDDFGLPLLFAGAVIIEICLIVVFMYSVVRAFALPLHILWSLVRSAWGGIRSHEYVRRLEHTRSPLLRWVGRRLNPYHANGLFQTVGLVIAGYCFLNCCGVVYTVLRGGLITQTDARVLNLMPYIRTPMQTIFFRDVTFLAEPVTLVLLVAMTTSILWIKRRWAAGWIYTGVAVSGEAIGLSMKYLIARPQPARYLGLLDEHKSSFPSGHTLSAVILFGLLAYFLFRSFRPSFMRMLIVLGCTISVGMVGISRIYLGAHYPSDVLGSLYLGTAILTLVITELEVAIKQKAHGVKSADFAAKPLLVVVPLLILFSLVAAPPLLRLREAAMPATSRVLADVNQQTVRQLPLSSETLTGKTSEPIDFIYLGSADQIRRLFTSHGWYEADPSTVANTLKAVSVGFQGRQYLTAPVTPAYVASEPETFAFQQPTERNTLRQRHHTRLWRTQYRLIDGREVWVATASYDEGIELAGTLKLPTHRIAPDLDAEREYIIHSLGATVTQELSVAHAQAGQNASGDIFFTDGKAAVISL